MRGWSSFQRRLTSMPSRSWRDLEACWVPAVAATSRFVVLAAVDASEMAHEILRVAANLAGGVQAASCTSCTSPRTCRRLRCSCRFR
jgi:hypothetical protein